MACFQYTEEIVAWLTENYPHLGPAACSEHFGGVVSARALTGWASRRKLRWIRTGKPRKHDQSAVMKRLWREGKLTKMPPEEAKRLGAILSSKLKSGERQHPRGMLGKSQTERCRAASGERSRKMVADGTHPWQKTRTVVQRQAISERMVATLKTVGTMYSRAKRGVRDDIGPQFFRSRWEANYARYLNWLISQKQIVRWEYEIDTFWFEKIRRGVRSYTPDFKVYGTNGECWYVEVKGWMDAKSKTKLKRIKKYYPAVRVEVVGQKQYTEIERMLGKAIPNWEFAG